MTSSLWSGRPSPEAFLICLLGSAAPHMLDVYICVCVTESSEVTVRGKKKKVGEDESCWGAEMIRPPTDDSAPR